jgi:hypothetical protein
MLHNRGKDFPLDPAHVNCIEPHKRPYHTLSPCMILRGERPFMVLGTPGAPRKQSSHRGSLSRSSRRRAQGQGASNRSPSGLVGNLWWCSGDYHKSRRGGPHGRRRSPPTDICHRMLSPQSRLVIVKLRHSWRHCKKSK